MLFAVRSALQEAGIEYESAEVQFVRPHRLKLMLKALKVMRLIDALEDSRDVQNVSLTLMQRKAL